MRPLAGLSAPVLGAVYMTLGALTFALTVASVRFVSDTLPIIEIVFFRSFLGLVFLTPWMLRNGAGAFRTARFPLHGLRAVLNLGAMVTWFAAISVLPLGDAVALQFTMPFFTIILAVVLLGEKADGQVWAAMAVGFAGALIVIRPGFVELDMAALLVLASAVLYAATLTVIKILSRTDAVSLTTFYMQLLTAILSLVPMLFYWRTPTLAQVPWLLAIGVMGVLTHYLLACAVSVAEASVVMPVDFLRLPFSAACGYVLFSQVPDPWSWAGAAIIFAAAYHVTWREARLARRAA